MFGNFIQHRKSVVRTTIRELLQLAQVIFWPHILHR